MQLTELLFQKVKDLSGQGQLSLKPGYVAIVSKAPSLRTAMTAPLCPAPDDQKRLIDGAGPTRVGVGLTGGDGSPYRLLREMGGSRQLLRLDTLPARRVRHAACRRVHRLLRAGGQRAALAARQVGGGGERGLRRPSKSQGAQGRAGADQKVRGHAGPALQGGAAPPRPESAPRAADRGRGGRRRGGGRARARALDARADEGALRQGGARQGRSQEARRRAQRHRPQAPARLAERAAGARALPHRPMVLRRPRRRPRAGPHRRAAQAADHRGVRALALSRRVDRGAPLDRGGRSRQAAGRAGQGAEGARGVGEEGLRGGPGAAQGRAQGGGDRFRGRPARRLPRARAGGAAPRHRPRQARQAEAGTRAVAAGGGDPAARIGEGQAGGAGADDGLLAGDLGHRGGFEARHGHQRES